MTAAFAARVNLVTQVMEVMNFSCWSRKSRIGTEAHAKIVGLQCFKMYQPAFFLYMCVQAGGGGAILANFLPNFLNLLVLMCGCLDRQIPF